MLVKFLLVFFYYLRYLLHRYHNHMWVRDVYDGAVTITTASLSIIPKFGVFSILVQMELVTNVVFVFNTISTSSAQTCHNIWLSSTKVNSQILFILFSSRGERLSPLLMDWISSWKWLNLHCQSKVEKVHFLWANQLIYLPKYSISDLNDPQSPN